MSDTVPAQDVQENAKIPAVTPTGLAEPVNRVLPGVIERLAYALHPDKIILFGSYAYGIPTPDSDVDLLVVIDTPATVTERYLMVSRLLRPRPFPVDILVRTPEEIRAALAKGDFFVKEILSRGKVLYERPD